MTDTGALASVSVTAQFAQTSGVINLRPCLRGVFVANVAPPDAIGDVLVVEPGKEGLGRRPAKLHS